MADNPLYIGMMRANRRPGATARGMAHAAHMFGVDFCFFNPTEVDLYKSQINGWQYAKTGWRRCTTSLPDVIINDRSSARKPKVWKELARRVPFTSPEIGDKAEVFNRMRDGGFYTDLQIPTTRLLSFNDVEDFLQLHQKIVVKPQNGSKGKNVFYFGVEEKGFRVNAGPSWEHFDANQLQSFYNDKVHAKGFIAQRYIDSVNKNGIPFDVRLHVRRDRTGEFSVIRVVTRIGSGRSIASNVAEGGSMAPLRAFLEFQYGETRGNEVRKQLRELAKRMPEHFQGLYKDRRLEALGIDVGLDASGKPWLFEMNAFPGTTISSMDAAIARIGYAIYVAENESVAKTSQSVWQNAVG